MIWMYQGHVYDDLAVRNRAPIELACDPGAVVVQAIDAKTRVARGCDRQIVYVYTGELFPLVVPGTWVANSELATR